MSTGEVLRSRCRLPPLHTWQALGAALALGCLSLLFVGQSNDFENYARYFDAARSSTADSTELFSDQRFEPVFAALSALLAPLLSDVTLLALLAGLSFFVKWTALARLSVSSFAFWGAALLYLVRFAPLHELTQIRLAIALAIWMLALTQAGRPAFWALLVLFPLTHYSTLVLLPLTLIWRMLVLNPKRYLRMERWIWPTVVLTVVAVGGLLESVLQPLSAVFLIIEVYSTTGTEDGAVNVFNVPTLLNVSFWCVLAVAGKKTPAQRFWLWTLLLGFCIFVAGKDFPVVAHRMYEMLSLAWIPLLATMLPRKGLGGQVARLYLMLAVPLYLYVYAFSANAVLVT